MRFINVVFIALIVLALVSVGYIYEQNHAVMSMPVVLSDHSRIRVSMLLVGVFLAGFVLNLLYTGVMELTRLVKGLQATAANQAGKKLVHRLRDARELSAHGLLAEARQSLEGLVAERSDDPRPGLLLGEVLLKLGESERAMKHYEGMVLAFPDLVEARYQLAEALVLTRNPDGAVAVLRNVAGDHPKQALRALRRLRALHTEAGRWEDALETHKRLLSRFGSELNAAERAQGVALAYQVGLLRVEVDQFKEAAQIFQQSLKEDPNFVPAYLSLGRCMILQDQEAQGLEIWLEGFRTTGEGALLQEVEDFFIQSGRPEDGLGVLRRVSATSEHGTTARFFLGKMLYRLEILDEALEHFQEVRAQVVYSPILFFFMAKIHARRGRLEQALTEYRQLLRNIGILKLRYECSACGHRSPDYTDRCEGCGSWNSLHFLFRETGLPTDQPQRPETGQWMLG